jgi:hypothetical protein
MSKNLVTVWNASSSIVKIGEDRTVLNPAETVRTEQTDEINSLVDSGKLIIAVSNTQENVASVNTETQTRKKNKKDIVEEEVQQVEVLEENNNQPPIEDTEVPEDSILPEESV